MPLPPEQVTRAVIQRFARIQERYRQDLGARPFPVPNGEYFPDVFEGDELSVQLLVARLQEHAGMTDIPLSARVVTVEGTASPTSSCSSGSCAVPQSNGSGVARVIDSGDEWILQVPATELSHPTVLTTNLARSLAYIFLIESQSEGEIIEPPVDVSADLVAVALGLGTLMLEGSYLYAKSCGGPQVASVTKVSVQELAVATALFAQLHRHKLPTALKAIGLTQRESLKAAHELLLSNPRLVDILRRDPRAIADGHFELQERKSLIARWFGKSPRHQRLRRLLKTATALSWRPWNHSK
ncbi:MAG: hypothetical protein MK135_02220 [Polyangiaceae bacterium]|nr:hypothetical protein [Polyangiaceae bacterium]